MTDYAETTSCKRAVMLHYFEESQATKISNCCSNCGIAYEPYLAREKEPEIAEENKELKWLEKITYLFKLDKDSKNG